MPNKKHAIFEVSPIAIKARVKGSIVFSYNMVNPNIRTRAKISK